MKRITLALGLVMTMLVAVTAATGAPGSAGTVFTLSNSPAGNAVLAYSRAGDGTLTPQGSFATGGTGTGANLGSQGALVLSNDDHQLFAVNAGSNSISWFDMHGGTLELKGTVPSGGTTPISLTVHGKVLYVLNAGGAGNISGFSIDHDSLTPIPGSTQPMGVGASGPTEIAFSPDGNTLIATEKNSSSIDTYVVGHDGRASTAAAFASAGATPFGFDFDNRGNVLVSNASGSASSYANGDGARLSVISAAVATNQGASCWLVAGKNGRFAYTANAAAGSISGFSVGPDGSLTLLNPTGVSASTGGPGSHPTDESVTGDGRYLYNVTDGLHELSGFRIADDGTLSPAGILSGLPVGSVGLATT